jgi:hypothetical protein
LGTKDHRSRFKTRSNNSKFDQHLLDNGQVIGPMEDTVEVVHIADKGPQLKTLAKYYIYKESKKGTKISDKYIVNDISDTLARYIT